MKPTGMTGGWGGPSRAPGGPGPPSPPTALAFTLPAEPGSPSISRERLQRWLDTLGWQVTAAEDIIAAVSEAVSNACEHAYRDQPPGTVTVTADLEYPAPGRRRLRIRICDHGRWRPRTAAPSHRGRGLTMMAAFMDTVTVGDASPPPTDIETPTGGTTITLVTPTSPYSPP